MSWNHDGVGSADWPGLVHLDGLYTYALLLTRNHSEAEDLVQETYVRAIPAMGRLRVDSNTKGWLCTILRNIWLNQLRTWRNGPQMIEIDAQNGITNSIADPSKNSHDVYFDVQEYLDEYVGSSTRRAILYQVRKAS